jgi:hypothetical protein
MFLLPTFILAGWLTLCQLAQAKALNVKQMCPPAFRAASENLVTSHVLTLSKRDSNGLGFRSAANLLNKLDALPPNSTIITALRSGIEYATTIRFGNQSFQAVVDTGSSDTWVAKSDFQCIDFATGKPTDQAICGFGPLYQTTSTFNQTVNENLNMGYGGGELLSGILGTEEVTLGGVQVEQVVGIINHAMWDGDGTTSGLIGLSYPGL